MSHPSHRNGKARFLFAGILAGIVVGLLATWFLMRPAAPKKAVEWPTVSRSNLVLRANQWFTAGGSNLFAGWAIEQYPDGSLRSRAFVSNGLLNGLCEGWYTNQQLQIQEHFKNSISDGLREKWFPNGQLQSQATIVNGKIEGTFRRWYENGQLAEQIAMKNGQPDGVSWEYFPSGFAKAKTRVSDGKILDRQVWEDGKFMASAAPRGAQN